MTEPDFSRMRAAMIDGQLRPNTVTDDKVIGAFRRVPREEFVPDAFRPFAYYDEDIEVAPGRFLMEPLTLGRLLERAKVRSGERVLVVGGSTGYAAALLADMGAKPVLLDTEAVRPASALGSYDVETVEGPLAEGHAAGAPYGLVLIEGFVPRVPDALIGQVAEGGRIAGVVRDENAPRAGIGHVFGGRIGWNFFADAYVPALPGFEPKKAFSF